MRTTLNHFYSCDFRVETVGDCYLAVAGLPEPRDDHAVIMARFAADCRRQMKVLVCRLEVSLGPDTGELLMRFGLHSGPVTAGVLRGDKARFQLFGDTINTASRIASTCEKGRIQVSQETAKLLCEAGKEAWLTERDTRIQAKGKGELKTFWLEVSRGRTQSVCSEYHQIWDDDTVSISKGHLAVPDNVERLVSWSADIFLNLLGEIAATRSTLQDTFLVREVDLRLPTRNGTSVLDEVKEIISLPKFDSSTVIETSVELEPELVKQVRHYITTIALLYRKNPFHNFEHACHVSQSVVKLLSRIVALDIDVEEEDIAAHLHDHTYGITSDPLTRFACVFSALIHDVDHTGIPNTQLIKENAQIATLYKGKSVAEQNSVDIAWDLLMDDGYSHFRSAIFSNEDELKRFRQLVVNSVMATDIMDKELKQLRNGRWEKAFKENPEESNHDDVINRKATIVIEHLIQASDVAHTMQHWHIYREWNENLFREMYLAYKQGRAEKDPSEFWYKGEMGFFDFYIIPLAKKLADCGVFGVSSFEYLNYAEVNRQEWEKKGQQIVAELVASFAKND
jgi:hypothetical protein